MVNNTIEIPTTPERFLSDYLRSLNGILNLTDKQLRCLEEMIKINKNYTATTEIRKQLVKGLGLKGVPDVTNIIKALKDKGAIKEDRNNRRYEYNPLVIPKALKYSIVFKVEQHESSK